MTGAFDHVGLNVPDFEAGIAWYVAALGLEETMRFEIPGAGLRGAMLQHGDGWRLEVLSRPGAGGGMRPGSPIDAALTLGYSHFALRVASVRAAYDDLLAHGATDRMTPRPSPDPSGLPMAYVADPWGNLIELLERG